MGKPQSKYNLGGAVCVHNCVSYIHTISELSCQYKAINPGVLTTVR